MRATYLAAILVLTAPGVLAQQSVEALEAQLDKARDAAPMVVKPFIEVTRPAKYFGDIENRPPGIYRRGDKMQFYGEPRNLVQAKNTGTFEPAMEIDIEVVPEKGEIIRQPKFMSMRIPSRSRINDLYVNLTVSLGGAPSGKYTLKFLFRDLNSTKTALVEQSIELK